jgi:hypothetical protein
LETKVWEFVRSLMLDPEHLLEDIERMIEEERNTLHGDPEREAVVWLDSISAAERKRSGFQDMAAEGLITLDELRNKLAELDDLRKTAERELRAIEGRKDVLRQLEEDRDSLIEHYANMAPEALDSLTPEERHQLYKILRLRVMAAADRSLTAEGMFGEFSVHEESSTWEMLPKEMGCGSGSTCWRRLRDWQEAGVWEELHGVLLNRLGEADRIDWERASLDSASVPAKREKGGTKQRPESDG